MTGDALTGPAEGTNPETGVATGASAPEQLAVAFARVLRGGGLSVPIGCVLTFGEGLAEVGLEDRDTVYWTARATLIRRPEDLPFFERAFAVFWDLRRAGEEPPPEDVLHITLALDTDEGDDQPDEGESGLDEPTLTLRFSAVETLRHKDFAAYSHDELHEAQQLMADLRLAGSPRRSRRLVKAKAGRHPRQARPDLRRTIHASIRAGGEPISQRYREPGQRLRRLVLLLDVSGSMEPYARALLRFVQAAVAGRQRVEAFALGTRLTRVTRGLSSRDPDRALAQAADQVHDWSGGTRLGECLRRFNDQWGVRGMARGAIVVVLSDGWDRGEPEVLAEQMARLHRVAHQVVWVNPLKVTPGYAPLARGMAAALPYVDDFVEGHSVVALEELAEVIFAMKEILDDVERWRAAGKRVAIARVVNIEGSGPRDPGAAMAVNEDAEVAGSVSGGCVEGAVVTEALDILGGDGPGRMVSFGYSDDEAFVVGLTCGGTIRLFIEPLNW